MDTATTQPPPSDGDSELNQTEVVSADDCKKINKLSEDSAFEVSNEKTTKKQIQTPSLEVQPNKSPQVEASKATSPQLDLPNIVVHSPEGNEIGLENTRKVDDNPSSSSPPGKSNGPDLDADESDSQSSHYLTPPSSAATTPVARPTSLMVSPESDSSVTNDEDIQVICRCSSTPVKSCIGKSLNDTGCSMSTVDDASPISAAEISKANVSSNRCAVASEEIEKPKLDSKDTVEQDVMFVQQQSFPTRPHPDASNHHHEKHDPKSPFGMYGRDHEYPLPYQQDCTNHSMGIYQGVSNDYNPSYMHSQNGYTEYYPNGQRSWTDVRGRFDRPYVSYPIQNDPRCFSPSTEGGGGERMSSFVYPSIYVSSAGLIAVLLRNDMSVEMTVDRTIRVVSHNHMMAVATDSKGTSACLYHPAVKVFQMGYATDISTDNFRARMDNGDAIMFSNGASYFRLQESELQPIAPVKFSDINRDQSVNLLFSSEGYGESLVATCMQVAAQAEYANLPKGGVIVRINGVKVTQSGCGDVTVVTGAKFIRLSPHNGTTRLGNRFLDIEVERDWSVKLTRGAHSFISTKKQITVCNGKMEAGFDENSVLKVVNLQARYPLLNDPSSIVRRPGRKIVRSVQSSQSASNTPRRRFPIQGAARGGASC